MGSESENGEEWKKIAENMQFELNSVLGSREWDEINKNDLFKLKRKIGFAACGNPQDMPSFNNYCTGYKDDDLEMIKIISEKIINISEHDPILFACTFLIVYWDNSMSSIPVFRVVNSETNILFVDTNGRVYKSWESFVTNNQLQKCIYCAPKNGEYVSDSILELQYIESPACKLINQALDHMDTVATVAAIGATVTSFFVAAPILIPVLGVSAAYNTVRSANTLYDRRNHEQSINVDNREARSAWLNIAGSAVGFGAAAAFGKASKIVDGGQKLSKFSVFGIKALNASSLVFNGVGFVDNLFLCKEKYIRGTLTSLDVFHLSCEVLFFYNAFSSVQATSNMLNQMSQLQVSEGSKANIKLTKSQKRNLRRKISRQKAKLAKLNMNVENSQNTIGGTIPTLLAVRILSRAVGVDPRYEEILYQYHAIGHDIKCWFSGELNIEELFNSCLNTLPYLYNNIIEDIRYMIEVVQNLSLKINEYFCSASCDQQSQFCISVQNLDCRIDSIIKNVNREVELLTDSSETENNEEGTEYVEQSLPDEESKDEGIAIETYAILRKVDELIISNFQCNSLEDYQYIVESVKAVVIEDFLETFEQYKSSVNAEKNSSAGFNLDNYNKELGIEGDCGQYFFNQTLNSIHCRKFILKINSALHENRINHHQNTNILEGIGNTFSFEGRANMSEEEILCMIENKLRLEKLNENYHNIFKEPVQKNNFTILFFHPRVNKEIKGNERQMKEIVVYYKYNEDNTISGIFNLYE